jgi:hypothetical protein
MRKSCHAGILFSALLLGTGAVWAEGEGPAAAAPVSANPAPASPAPAAKKAPTAEERLLQVIDGTSWAVELTPMGGEGKPTKDTINFAGRQVTSKFLDKHGYGTSNFTLTIGGDGVPVWETMQTKEGEGVAFWRGEFHGDSMRGILSKQMAEGATQDYSFAGRESSGRRVAADAVPSAAPASSSTAAAPAPSAPAAVTPPPAAATPQPKKKRGWFQ